MSRLSGCPELLVADAGVLLGSGSTVGQRIGAAASLATEVFSPVSARDAKAGYRAIAGADDVGGAVRVDRVSTLTPGPHAGESISLSGPGRATARQQQEIDRIGQDSGCHTCGATNPGTQSGHHVLDHQPPTKLNSTGNEQRGYPHCIDCSRRQGGEVNAERRRLREQ